MPKSSIASTRKIPGEHQLGPTEYTCVVGEPEQPSHCGTTGMRFPHGTERDGLPSPRYRLSSRSLTPRTGQARRGDLAAKKGPRASPGCLCGGTNPSSSSCWRSLHPAHMPEVRIQFQPEATCLPGRIAAGTAAIRSTWARLTACPRARSAATLNGTRSGAATALTTPIRTDSYAKARNYLLADRTVWLAE
jgi:hypothetical protein